jgi:uncharacterized protein (TIGR00255 family)
MNLLCSSLSSSLFCEVVVLLSMTGYGEARYQSDSLNLAIELRALNNRHLKVTVRAADPYHLLEAEFEKVIRRIIRRGTLQVHLRCEKQSSAQDFRLNQVALRSYIKQVQSATQDLGVLNWEAAVLPGILALPGVVVEPGSLAYHLHEDWPLIERVLMEALASLQAMRREEGQAMAQELLVYRGTIAASLDRIRQQAPKVSDAFRDRLLERVRNLLKELDVQIDRNDLIREVSIFAERSDIAEEVVRLGSHLDQFPEIMNEDESPGRKLEFLTQEMVREANTIGSKASDVEISREVVDIKGTLEKIRELIQNVE